MYKKRNCISFICIIVLFDFLSSGCSLIGKSVPEIQYRNYNEPYKTIEKVTFQNVGYKGVFRVNLNDDISSELVPSIAEEITEKYNCSLVISPFPEVKNPDTTNKWIFIENAKDDSVIEMGKDERIKFISQHYPDN